MKSAIVSFFRGGNLLHANRDGKMTFVSFGQPTGCINNATCFESITFRDDRGTLRTVSEASYRGPVTVRVRGANGGQWFGIASAATVATITSVEAVEV